MSYVKQTWNTGDIVTAEKLNHIEDGIFNNSSEQPAEVYDTSSKIIYKEVESLSSGNNITLNIPCTKNHYQINFNGVVNTMGKLTISDSGPNDWIKGKVEIDNTNIVVSDYAAATTKIYPHGLTISNILVVNIRTTHPRKAIITIATGTDYSNEDTTFKKEIEWNGCYNTCIATLSNSGSFGHCRLSFGGSCYLKKVWIFGDSWTDHWPQYADYINCNNFLLDGWSGRSSTDAYTSFIDSLRISTPKAVLWMLGMNDPDSTGVNSNWQTVYNNVKNKCNELNIEFIGCTICNTPDRKNYYKNNYIRTSGVRYIDLSNLCGCANDTTGSYGYGNILSRDGTHCNNAGRLLVASLLTDSITAIINEYENNIELSN